MNHHKLIKLTSPEIFYHIPNPNFLSYPVFRCRKIVRVIFKQENKFKQENTHQPNQQQQQQKNNSIFHFLLQLDGFHIVFILPAE